MKQIIITKCAECSYYWGKPDYWCEKIDQTIEDAQIIHINCPLTERVSRDTALNIIIKEVAMPAYNHKCYNIAKIMDKLGYEKEGK